MRCGDVQILCSAPLLCGGLQKLLLFIIGGKRAPGAIEFPAKLLYRVQFRAHLLLIVPCRREFFEAQLRRRALLPCPAHRLCVRFHRADLRRVHVRFLFEPGDALAEFAERCDLLRLQHLFRTRAILRRGALEHERFLRQRFLEPPIAFRAKNALHDRAAILDLGEQKPLKLSLRQQNDLPELIGVESDQRTDAP